MPGIHGLNRGDNRAMGERGGTRLRRRPLVRVERLQPRRAGHPMRRRRVILHDPPDTPDMGQELAGRDGQPRCPWRVLDRLFRLFVERRVCSLPPAPIRSRLGRIIIDLRPPIDAGVRSVLAEPHRVMRPCWLHPRLRCRRLAVDGTDAAQPLRQRDRPLLLWRRHVLARVDRIRSRAQLGDQRFRALAG